jgi:hypothetical protein
MAVCAANDGTAGGRKAKPPVADTPTALLI